MNNNSNSNLNDFLNKSRQSLEDNFEKDAFEGFETLNSKEEALELKASLDKKIAPVFTERKQNYRIVWYAAAGLILIIGLSIFFIQTNNDAVNTTKNISLVETKKQGPIDIKPENSNATEEVITEKKANEQQKEVVSDAKALKDEPPMEAAKKLEGYKTANFSQVQTSSTSDSVWLNNIALAGENKKSAGQTSTASGDFESEKASGTFMAPAKREASGKFKNEEAEVVNGTKVVTHTPNKSLAEDSDQKNDEQKESDLKERAVLKENKGRSRKKTKPESPKTMPAAGASQQTYNAPEVKMDEGVNNTLNSNTRSETTTTVDSKDKTNQCYYSGGETNLKNDLSEKLTSKNVNKKFDASLFINENKIVEKVTFINAYSLTPAEKQTIENTLKTLSKFNFYVTPTSKTWFEYKIEYRP